MGCGLACLATTSGRGVSHLVRAPQSARSSQGEPHVPYEKILMIPLGVPWLQTLDILTRCPAPGASMILSPPM